MKRSGPIKRYTPPRKRRATPRRGEPTAQEKTALRRRRYEHAGGRCELHLLPGCIPGVLAWDGPDPWSHGHLAHVKSRGAGGKWTFENLRWACHVCHLIGVHTKGMKIDEC